MKEIIVKNDVYFANQIKEHEVPYVLIYANGDRLTIMWDSQIRLGYDHWKRVAFGSHSKADSDE